MNEETKRKLNSTQTIADNMDNIIEAFVTYYGEENRERITNRFSEELDYKYRIEMIKEIREYFSEEEYYKIINSERHMINSNSKLRNVIGYQIDNEALISAFNKGNEEILMSGNDDWKTDGIKREWKRLIGLICLIKHMVMELKLT